MALKWNGKEVIEKVERAAMLAIDETTAECVAIAKPQIPKDTTLLQGAVNLKPARKIGNFIVGVWGAFNNKYAVFVELGTSPHFPPIEALKGWARRRLGDEDAAWPVAMNISKVGTKPQPVFRPTADKLYPKLAGRIKKHYGG